MSTPPVSPPRFAAELVLGSVFAIAGVTVIGLGVATWLLTLLPAAYPCGETYQVHPSCRLADPAAVTTGYLVMIGIPLLCTLLGIVTAIRTFIRRRRAAAPLAIAFGLALAAFLTGHAMVSTAIHDVVPW